MFSLLLKDLISDFFLMTLSFETVISPKYLQKNKVLIRFIFYQFSQIRGLSVTFLNNQYFAKRNSHNSEQLCLLLGPQGFNCWFSFAPVFQWCCSTPRGSPGVDRNTFLSSPHLCFITVFICDLFVSRDDPLMS